MQIVKPRQISGDIMTLIEEADEKVIIISPYFKVKNWYKMLHSLNAIKEKCIPCEIYVRENEHESINEVKFSGFEPITIPNLHTKLYMNEKMAIVSSMNLLYSSDTNSLDIALKTENEKEYRDLWDYYVRYIKKSSPENHSVGTFYDWRQSLEDDLSKLTGRNVYINESFNSLQIKTSNNYEVIIKRGGVNELHISGILSVREYEYATRYPSSISAPKLKVIFAKGGKGYYDTVQGILGNLKTNSVNDPKQDESKRIVSAIVEFISEVEQLKKIIRNMF